MGESIKVAIIQIPKLKCDKNRITFDEQNLKRPNIELVEEINSDLPHPSEQMKRLGNRILKKKPQEKRIKFDNNFSLYFKL